MFIAVGLARTSMLIKYKWGLEISSLPTPPHCFTAATNFVLNTGGCLAYE